MHTVSCTNAITYVSHFCKKFDPDLSEFCESLSPFSPACVKPVLPILKCRRYCIKFAVMAGKCVVFHVLSFTRRLETRLEIQIGEESTGEAVVTSQNEVREGRLQKRILELEEEEVEEEEAAKRVEARVVEESLQQVAKERIEEAVKERMEEQKEDMEGKSLLEQFQVTKNDCFL